MDFWRRYPFGVFLVALLNIGAFSDALKSAKLKQIVGLTNNLVCPQGYMLYTNGVCYDINECQAAVFPCGKEQFCINTAGSYVCADPSPSSTLKPTSSPKADLAVCPRGYVLYTNGFCYDVDECRGEVPPCDKSQLCVNTAGSFHCVGTAAGPTPGPVTNPKTEQGTILALNQTNQINPNQGGGQIPGQGTGTAFIQIAPEVGLKPSLGPGPSPAISNVQCGVGFVYNHAANRCVDVDECSSGTHQCGPEQNCQNYEGGYSCYCKPEFPFNPATNRCGTSNLCPQGLVLNNQTYTCHDIDECRDGNACDGPNDICQNIYGSYRCHKIECPPGYTKEALTANSTTVTCTRNEICQPGDIVCINKPYTILYSFLDIHRASASSGPAELMSIHDMQTYPDWTAQFSLNFIRANAIKGAVPATLNNFNLRSYITHTVLLLTQNVEGPQDIELEIAMRSFNDNGMFAAVGICRLLIVVTE